MKSDQIRDEINARIVAAMSKGTAPWRKPWATGFPKNVVSKKDYRGINVLLLQIQAMDRGYSSPYWATLKQWGELGVKVKKRPADIPPGHYGTGIVFFNWRKIKKMVDGEEKELHYPLLRYYTVFNLDQCEGDVEKYQVNKMPGANRHEEAERILTATGINFRHGGHRAFYSPEMDFVQMPNMKDFESTESYYGTKFHEAGHATGHPSRLDRLPKFVRFGDNSYAMEELVADLCGCYLQAHVGLPISDLENHASYMNAWVKVLKADPKAIFQATSAASKAADWILGIRDNEPEYNGEETPEGVAELATA